MAFKRRHVDKRTFFISAATAQNKGSLRAYVERVLGRDGFEMRGGRWVIKPSVVRRLAAGACLTHGKMHECPNETTQRRARLALTLARIRARRR